MKAFFRVDSSVKIGSGHHMRCMTLAEALEGQGFEIHFISRELPGHLHGLVKRKGWFLHPLPYRPNVPITEHSPPHISWLEEEWEIDCRQTMEVLSKHKDLDWLVVDHYALDDRWETMMRQAVKHVMVIDDLADRTHDCDLLLDQNLQENMAARYQGLVPEHCRQLLGPCYAMLRREFAEKRKGLRHRTGELRRVLVFFGGSDPFDVTGMAVRAFLGRYQVGLEFDVVVGGSNPNKEWIRECCGKSPNFHYHCQVDNMAGLIERADLAFGAAGASIWERLCLGLPSMVVSMAENQDTLLKGVLDKDLLIYLGSIQTIREEHFHEALNQALTVEGKQSLLRMSKSAMDVVDGLGCDRVVSAIVKFPSGQLD